MAVKPIFTLICDDVRIENSNKLIIIGLYSYAINFSRPPAQVSDAGKPAGGGDQAPKLVMPLFCIVRRWKLHTPIKVTTELIDPNGTSAHIAENHLPVSNSDDYSQELIKVVGIILVPGTYTIRATCDDPARSVHDERFEVKFISSP
jgi:hypothetical protein